MAAQEIAETTGPHSEHDGAQQAEQHKDDAEDRKLQRGPAVFGPDLALLGLLADT